MKNKIKLGLLINPIAGMGGKVGLKGTDGENTLRQAILLGAKPTSCERAVRAFRQLLQFRDSFEIYTASGDMGEELCRQLLLSHQVVYHASRTTDASDTLAAAKCLQQQGVSLLVFAGGDGTARNIFEAVGQEVSVLGIPAGVKIQSAVFALTPELAGLILCTVVTHGLKDVIEREVVDLDEEEYRKGHVSATLYGTMLVPNHPQNLQCMKQGGFSGERSQLQGISHYLMDTMQPNITYAIGPGRSTQEILSQMGISGTLLGVDIICNNQLVYSDAAEETVWNYAKQNTLKIIVSPIGGQGFLFGRGNHQFSSRVLSKVGKQGILVLSTESKILSIDNYTLHIDCEDEAVYNMLTGYYKVLTGYGYYYSLLCK